MSAKSVTRGLGLVFVLVALSALYVVLGAEGRQTAKDARNDRLGAEGKACDEECWLPFF